MDRADVVVVGGGNSAGQAALHLAQFARTVTIVIRRDTLQQTMSHYLIDEISAHDRIDVNPNCEIVDGGGAARLEWLERNTVTGETTRRDCGGLFLLLGAEPRCEWLPTGVTATPAASCSLATTSPKNHGPTGFLPKASPLPYPACSPSATPAPAR